MPPQKTRPSLSAVARKAGVSPMTVSRVFQNSPKVSPETRRRVEQSAKALGYQPNPLLARLMTLVRAGKPSEEAHSVIGIIRDDIPEDELHDPAYQFVSILDIRKRAERHGYRAEEFWLGRDGMTANRIGRILQTRAIEGIIISPQSARTIGARLDYSHFAAATFGYGLSYPALHRASTNMTHGILTATAELASRGYRRIGLAVTRWIDERSNHTYSGAMLYYQQQIATKDRVPLLLIENNLGQGEKAFCSWIGKHRPDAIISFHTYVPDWLESRLGMKIPEDIGLVVHDWGDRMKEYAGIHHRRAYVAGAAVELVASQLLQNQRGIPSVPHQVLIPPEFIDGPSIRPKK